MSASTSPIPFRESNASLLAECKRRAPDFDLVVRASGQDVSIEATCTIEGRYAELSIRLPPQQSVEVHKRQILESCLRDLPPPLRS